MPNRLFLNALRSKQGGLPAPDKGIWHRDNDFLMRYAADVNLEGELEAGSIPNSVPSVFQRPFQFLHALRHDENPHHYAMVSEWRGLMALIALKDWLGVKVTATPFVVPDVPDTASSYVGNEEIGNLHFKAILRHQLPYRKIEREKGKLNGEEKRVSDWEKWWVIRCDGKLIGATSPWTMVYTASKYKAPQSIAWQKEGLLIDPIDYFASLKDGPSKPIELAILYALVKDVLKERGTWGIAKELSTFAGLYSNLLESWLVNLAPYEDKDLTIGNTASLFEEAPYSSSLRSVAKMDRGDSDLYMDTRKGRVIVFTKSTGPYKRVYRGMFAGQIDIAALDASGDSFRTIDGRVVPSPYIVAEKAFFPAKLIHLELSDKAFVAKNSPKVSTPLKPAFFEYFSHKDLFWVSVQEMKGGVTATLSLPLTAGGEALAAHWYDAKDIQELDMKTPSVALWPDHYDEKWKGGFAAYAGPDSDDLAVGPLYQSGHKVPASDWAEIGKNQQEVRIWQCEEEPAIGFSLKWRSLNSRNERLDAGLILLKALRPMGVVFQSRKARIGVDFGTSSTMVMIADQENPEDVVELKFGGRLNSLTNDDYGRLIEIERNLYPSESVIPPFRTLLYEKSATQFGKQTTPYIVRFVTSVKYDLLNAPIANLKWGAQVGRDGSNPLTAYLNGLVRYIVWECLIRGIRNITFYWSYPTSLPEGQLTTMRSFWTQTIRAEKYHEDLKINVMEEMSESEAACRALTAGPARLRTGSLTIAVDIGGGSTDIAYWSSKANLDQSSFKLAGNDMLDKLLLTPKTMTSIFSALAKPQPGVEELASIHSRPEIYLNDLLAATGADSDPLTHPLRNYIFDGRDSVVPWQTFRSMIYLYFTGLCYYMGAQTRSVAVEKPEIEVYFGGRGASLLSWFAADKEDVRKVLNYAFRLGLNRPKDDNIPNAFPSTADAVIRFESQAIVHNADLPDLKTEVAKGLLLSPDVPLSDQVKAGVSVGETGWMMRDGQSLKNVDWMTRIRAEDLENLKAPSNSAFGSNMIGHFCYVVFEEDKEKFLTKFNLDAPRLKALKVDGGAVEDLIQRSSEGKNQVAQPIFAYELKTLMSQYARMVSSDGSEKP